MHDFRCAPLLFRPPQAKGFGVRRLDPDTTETLATSSGAGPILARVFSQAIRYQPPPPPPPPPPPDPPPPPPPLEPGADAEDEIAFENEPESELAKAAAPSPPHAPPEYHDGEYDDLVPGV